MKRGFLKETKASKKPRKDHEKEKETEDILKEISGKKMPHGVVKEAGPPKNYKSEAVAYEEANANTLPQDDDSMLFTTQPSQLLGVKLADVPDGWSECFISALAKRRILSTPGFPQPIARTEILRYRISESPHKGLGMFATQDLEVGDLIFAERPILVTPGAVEGALGDLNGLTADQVRQAMLYDWEKHLEIVLSRVRPENQAAFRALHNSHLHDGSGPIMGICRTNGFEIETFRRDDEDGPEEISYSAVLKDGSRINHSCSPNIHRHWDTQSFSIQFRAARAIKKDEELTTTYCSLFDSSAKRQEYLAPYEIQCSCPACLNSAVSDPRRARLTDWLDAGYMQEWKSWLTNPKLEEDMMIKVLQETLWVLEEEGLETTLQYEKALRWMMNTYRILADEENAIIWGKRVGRWHLAATGGKEELTRLSKAANHRADGQWRLRKKGGEGGPPRIFQVTPELLEMFTKLGR